jgi:hypothetical protein
VSARGATRTFGIVFLAIGILGFVPGVTSHYGDLHFAGGSHARLLGEFRVSIVLNLVHVLIGAFAFVAARPVDVALFSLGLWLIGVFAAGGRLSLDTADNWLHFVLGVALLGLSTVAGRRPVQPAV